MRAALAAGLLAAASCQQVLGLHDLDRDAAPGALDSLAGDGALDSPASPDGPALDSDGDGVPDSLDNCPTVPNADQHDWDGDHHGDACDHCPHLPSAADPDTDGDGVGDACDPNPNTPGDRRVLWEGFYADVFTGSDAWTTAGSGAWSVSGGQLHQTNAAADLGDAVVPVVVVHAYVATQARLDSAPSATLNDSTVGVNAAYVTVGGGSDDGCVFNNNGSGSASSVSAFDNGAEPTAAWTGPAAIGTTIAFVELLDASNRCQVTAGSASVTVNGTASVGSGAISLLMRAQAVSYDYLFIVATGSGS